MRDLRETAGRLVARFSTSRLATALRHVFLGGPVANSDDQSGYVISEAALGSTSFEFMLPELLEETRDRSARMRGAAYARSHPGHRSSRVA